MWCPHCNKETSSVPTRTADGVCCAMCGQNYFREKPSEQTIREARDIIARWSSSDLLDQISTLPKIPDLRPSRPEPEEPDSEASAEPETEQMPDSKTANAERSEPGSLKPEDSWKSDAIDTTPSTDDTDSSETVDSSVSTIQVAPPLVTSRAQETPEQDKDTQHQRKLPRKSQTRTQRQRKLPAAALEEGTNSMSRKLRVDSPGGDQPELPADAPTNTAGGRIQSNSSTGRRHRIDSGSSIPETVETGSRRTRTQGPPRRRYIDDPHESVARGPHFEVTPQRRSNLTSITGQFLAYLGVLGLTVGTAMVIYGHFGGYSEYTPTGWLVTTVAQMMLFLGVINLVSGGMEQTNNDVSERMEYLGAQLMRIEQVTEEAMRGPKIPVSRYADPSAPMEEHDHAHAPLAED